MLCIRNGWTMPFKWNVLFKLAFGLLCLAAKQLRPNNWKSYFIFSSFRCCLASFCIRNWWSCTVEHILMMCIFMAILLPTNLFSSHFNEALIDSVEIYLFDSMCADCSTRWLWVLYLLLCCEWVLCTLLAGIYAHLFAYDDLGWIMGDSSLDNCHSNDLNSINSRRTNDF